MSEKATPSAETPQAAQNAEIDIEKLADMVYRLMRDDTRLERARGVPAPIGRRG
jgi:hypothetical protein